MDERLELAAAEYGDDPAVGHIVAFMRAESDRGLCLPEHAAPAGQPV